MGPKIITNIRHCEAPSVPSLRIIPTRERRVQQYTTVHCTMHFALCHMVTTYWLFAGRTSALWSAYDHFYFSHIHLISLFLIAGAWTWTATLGSSGPRGWTSWTPAPPPLSRALTRTMDPTPSVNLKPRRSGGEDQQKQRKYFFPRDFVMSKRHRLTSYIAFHRYKIALYEMSQSTDVFYLLQLWE